jgi:TRAP-type C4-dicarboxylate transport system permease small subunit
MARLLFVRLPHVVLGSLMLVGVAICFANVVGRYLFGYAMFWVEEVLVFLAIWGVFIGLASATYQRAHLSMDLFSLNLQGRARMLLNGVIAATLLACCAFMVVQSWLVVQLFYQSGVVSVAAGVPKWLSHAALPLGFAAAALAVLLRLRHHLAGKA